MDKKIGGLIKDTMGNGERMAPVKSIKLKVKFQKAGKKADKALEKARKSHSTPH